MITKEYKTVRERLFWSYANLAMAHTAVERKQDKYAAFNYMIRARLFKGLIDSTMNIRTLFDDEKIKWGFRLFHGYPQYIVESGCSDELVSSPFSQPL